MQRIDLLFLNVRQRAANKYLYTYFSMYMLYISMYHQGQTKINFVILKQSVKLHPSILNKNPKSSSRHIDIVAALVTLSGGYPLLMSGQRTLGYNAGQIGGKISDRIFSAWLRCLGLQTVESPRQWRPQTTLNLWPDSGEDINTELSRISKLQQLFSDF